MVKVSDIIARRAALLQPSEFGDLGPNGLQVPGAPAVDFVVTGVSATRELIERAVAAGAGLVLVHHGLFWDFDPPGLTRVQAERLRPLFKHDVNLAAYHIPLDAHPEHGNNALLAEALGCDSHTGFGSFKGRDIGRAGTFGGDGISVDELDARVREATGRDPLVFSGGPDRIKTLGIVSGSAASSLPEAVERGLDAFLTGEPREHVMGEAHEAGIHFIAAGHYATETFGVRRLGEILARETGVRHEFVDLPNPV